MPPPLLVRVGLRRPHIWDPPTVLDRLLAGPLEAAAYYLWQALAWLRSGLARSLLSSSSTSLSSVPAVRVVCLSDTHDLTVDVPPGDLLIHAGDLTNHGTPTSLQRQIDWLAAQPHRHKVVIAGNHDTWFDPAARAAQAADPSALAAAAEKTTETTTAQPTFPPDVHYLEHERIVLDFAGGRQLAVYGAADIPACGGPTMAFQYARESPPWKDTIPADIDILVTHDPPRYHRDLGLGCAGLLAEVWRVRPRLHVFGHVHWGAGREAVCWDGAQRAYEAVMAAGEEASTTFAARLADLARLAAGVVWAALSPLSALLVPGSVPAPPHVTVFVNAAQMYGNSGRMGRNVQVIDM